MFRKRVLIVSAVAAAAALSLSGCATIISGSRQNIDIFSPPDTAKVAIFDENNNKVFEASTPVTARLQRGSGFFSGANYRIEITKEGQEKQTTLVTSSLNTAPYLFGNLYGGGWIGLLILDPITGAMWKLSPDIIQADFRTGIIRRWPRYDPYFTAKYILPMGGMPPGGAYSIESGCVWGNGAFFGIDLDFGYGVDNNYKRGEREGLMAGVGFNLGDVYDLPFESLQLVYGGSVGFWFVGDHYYRDYYDYDDYDNSNLNFNFLAPFIKLRWKVVELSYRGLLGVNDGGDFGWNNHQVTVGLYFERSKRYSKNINNN